MGRPAFHPPPEAKGEGKGARSRAREGSEGGRGSEVGSVRSQPCAPTASLVMLFALFSPLTRSTLFHLALPCVTLSSTLSRYVVRSYVVFPSRRHPIFSTTLSTFCVVYSPAEFWFNDTRAISWSLNDLRIRISAYILIFFNILARSKKFNITKSNILHISIASTFHIRIPSFLYRIKHYFDDNFRLSLINLLYYKLLSF